LAKFVSVVNIGATAIVTEAATAMFGEAGVSAATGVMTVCYPPHICPLLQCTVLSCLSNSGTFYFQVAILLLTEITPKSVAVHNATEVARFVVR
jgi:Mg2+/Co2+ transporter CorB